ncbi:hypothetical protein PF011_g8746 [Phytophthora fragariae]|uniref:FH2 domain-containing protein n=1 Tax=Phytophthora fragariae TaxID=53985 RepID=A0A6A3KZQ1_9STRA|nr:hypothetical protein PF011_g8746 [Phytophthora fragariae]
MSLTSASFLLQAAPWVSLDVRRGSTADISIRIPAAAEQGDDPQECLVWQFVLQEYDVGFQLLENGVVVQDLGRFKAAEDDEGVANAIAINPLQPLQFEALEPTMEGRFDDVKPETVYALRWDNTYSLVRHKQLQYRFLVTSRRAVAAAELAMQESQSRSQRRARRAAAGLPLPHLAKTLAKERAMTDEERKVENERATARLEQAVMDIVSIFIAKPDSPLHEGAVRPFILALEAVLCNRIKEEFLDVWPEAPFYEFLLETRQVLRDDLGIVAEVQAGEAPPNLQYLGWNHARSFLLLALNKGILHRAFENLSKRRALVEKFYEPRAILYNYEDTRKIASFLGALNGVKFLLDAYPPDECGAEEHEQFPRNLKQCAPGAPLLGNEVCFLVGVEGDSSVVGCMERDPDKIKDLEDCTVPRYILHGHPFQDIVVGRSSIEVLSIPDNERAPILLAQLRIQTQDILLSLATDDSKDLTEPYRLSASDGSRSASYLRQHDCPCCKKIVCVQCSRHHVQVNGKGPQLKVCDGCFIKEKENERKRIASMKGKGASANGERSEYTALRSDPSMDKYFKMLNFGVPSSGVAQKMAQDNMPPEKIANFVAGPDGSHVSTYNGATRKRERAGSRGLNRRDSTFRKVYWTSLETKKANETIWARVTSRRKTAPITLSPQDFQELEFLFGNRTTALPSQSKEKTAKKAKFSALDSRRSNNISIGLSQFKAVGGADAILTALKNCDYEFLTVDRLTSLQDIAPNSVEVKRYTNFKGSRSRLEPSEKFQVEMCEISRVTEKINVMLFASQFEHQQKELRTRINVITQACYEVLRSERLARCFELVLAIGNLLNTGSELEGAQGITLASLLKLSETKAVDQSMTLLQFIVKLIHDRGEGDVLLFINDLSSLADAKRFSNVICESQARALQSEISKLEQEIKEDMVEDLKRFNTAEALRKRQFEERNLRPTPVSKQTGLATSDGVVSGAINGRAGSRNAMLDDIRQRGGGPAKQNEEVGPVSSNPHAAMLAAIRCRGETVGTNEDAQTSLPYAVRSMSAPVDNPRDTSTGAGQIDTTPVSSSPDAPYPSVISAIQNHSWRISEEVQANVDEARSSLLSAIRQRGQSKLASASDSNDSRSALLASIQLRRGGPSAKINVTADQGEYYSPGSDSQAALLAAIRQQARKPKPGIHPLSGVDSAGTEDLKFQPHQYKMESNFISVMRDRLLNIKAAFEDVEMELETLHSVWDGTARYLAEDPVGSSSEYVFGLLNRFLLDVKVAKSLLFRKGLSFANEANAVLPHAYVGSIVATKFGSGIITALRVADKRIEVKFPWSKEAYLAPSSILSAGSLVRCRRWGVGIIRETCYDVGFCDVRFSFGYGKIRVEELTLETSSNQEDLRLELLSGGFCIGDPVVTAFGCGHVQSIRGNPQCPAAILSVGLLASDPDIHGGERPCTATAFVSARHAKRKY